MEESEAPTTALLYVYNVDARPVALLRDLYSGLTTGTTDCHLCDREAAQGQVLEGAHRCR